jgi:hypothetical protein
MRKFSISNAPSTVEGVSHQPRGEKMKRFAGAHRAGHGRGGLMDHGRLYSAVCMNYIKT